MEKFHITGCGALAHGPDFTLNLKGAHLAKIHLIWEKLQGKRPEGSMSFGFFLTIDGRFASQINPKYAEKPIVRGVLRHALYMKRRQAFVTLGIPMRMILLSNEEFRLEFSELLLEGTGSLIKFLKRKKLDFDESHIIGVMEESMREYLSLPLPFPVSKSTIEIFGALQDPINC